MRSKRTALILLVLFLHAGCGGAQRDAKDTPARDRAQEICLSLHLAEDESEELSIFLIEHYHAQTEILSIYCDQPEAAREMLEELDRCVIEASRPYLDDQQISRLSGILGSREEVSCSDDLTTDDR